MSGTGPADPKEHRPRLRRYRAMAEQDRHARVWEIVEKVGVCMLTTRFAGGLRARPVEARPDRDAGLIWFLTDARAGKDDEIEAAHDVGLVFIDHGDKAYLSITARRGAARSRAGRENLGADRWRVVVGAGRSEPARAAGDAVASRTVGRPLQQGAGDG
jgi:general stress protein 26